jgi:hypothetical protein
MASAEQAVGLAWYISWLIELLKQDLYHENKVTYSEKTID